MTLLLGVLIGASIGFAACSLCVTSKQADEKAKAYGNHKKLVKACRRLDTYIIRESEAGRIDPDVSHDYWESVIADIRTALAEAEKE